MGIASKYAADRPVKENASGWRIWIMIGAILLVAGGNGPAARAASRTTETFSAGANGWVGTSGGFVPTASWSFTNSGVATLVFAEQGMIGFPDWGILSNAPTASGGSFTGNFSSAGIEWISFRFYAQDAPPSSVELYVHGPTSSYRRLFYVPQTGQWHTLGASFVGPDAGAWTNLAGPSGNFAQVLEQVRGISIVVSRDGGTAKRTYRIDDIALAPLHAVVDFSAGAGGSTTLRATDLFTYTGVTYAVESAPDVTGTWSVVKSFVPTGAVHDVALTGTTERLFWRLSMPP